MNKKKKSNLKKKLAPIALTGLIVIGASAWLTNKEVQQSTNTISVGTIGIKFVDTDSIVRSDIVLEGSKAIPMTENYANDTLTPYKFSIKNTGTMDLSYQIYLVCDENTFGSIDTKNEDGAVVRTKNAVNFDNGGKDGTYKEVTAVNAGEKQVVYSGSIKSEETISFENWILFIDEQATTAQTVVDGVQATAKYHLEVEAVQSNMSYTYNFTFTGDYESSDKQTGTANTIKAKDTMPLSSALNGAGGGPTLLANESEITKEGTTYPAGIYVAEWNDGGKGIKAVYRLYYSYTDEQTNSPVGYNDTFSAGDISLVAKKVEKKVTHSFSILVNGVSAYNYSYNITADSTRTLSGPFPEKSDFENQVAAGNFVNSGPTICRDGVNLLYITYNEDRKSATFEQLYTDEDGTALATTELEWLVDVPLILYTKN